jgi:hypothetical protein
MTAEIHVSLRLNQLSLPTFELTATYKGLALASFYLNTRVRAQFVNQHESEVMARPFIFRARISKANDQTLPIVSCQLPI